MNLVPSLTLVWTKISEKSYKFPSIKKNQQKKVYQLHNKLLSHGPHSPQNKKQNQS
jgi:hypothetical protein